MSVYFSKFRLLATDYEVAPCNGWHSGRFLRWIHAMRYKPAEAGDEISYQPEIMNERSNAKLAYFGCVWPEIHFRKNEKTYIPLKCELISNDGKLHSAQHSSMASRVTWDQWEDCHSFYYPSQRTEGLRANWQRVQDNDDDARREGFSSATNLEMYSAASVWADMEHASLAASPANMAETFHRLSSKMADLRLRLDIQFEGAAAPRLFLNGQPFILAPYSQREAITMALDLYVRFIGAGLEGFAASAIVLIEKPGELFYEVLGTLFPRVQFITE